MASHRGALETIACISITTPEHSHFYLQEKDNGHPIATFRNKIAFFGGKAEPNERTKEAAVRELREELVPGAASIVIPRLRHLFAMKSQRTYLLPKVEFCMLHLYEAQLQLTELRMLTRYPVLEGRRGVLFTKSELSLSLFSSHLHPFVKRYEEFWR